MIVGVILAAGESRRMGEPKALLKIGDHTFLDHIAQSLRASAVDMVYAVLGDHSRKIAASMDKNILCIYNPDYRQGQLSSLKTAIAKIQYENCDGILVWLVDHPLVTPMVASRLVEEFYSSKKRIIMPTHQGKRGHPVLYSREIFSALLGTSNDQGANTVRLSHLEHTCEVEVDDPGILIDIDTPEDYKRHITPVATTIPAF
ncbi:MAG: nucleotidyltransferase family protein [Acidobacteriia bacterium]|nr:nucleotidyltransferase family protein [Terriglobia bacterium]